MRTIELTDDQADELVVTELTTSMSRVVKDIIRLRDDIENFGLTLHHHQNTLYQDATRHDLSYDLAYFDALCIVLKHFTTHDSLEREIMDGLKDSIHNAEELP
jgi:hypothetical protein